jgi:isopropylmalate/homocitrate/citramalate synthase
LDRKPSPELYKETFPYTSLPRMILTDETVPMSLPEKIWLTDTTFRDGQQAREPYTVDQIVTLYDYMHRLSGPDGIIRFTEFFLYNARDREALIRCQELGYEFPKITSWIRAKKEDLELVKKVDVEETGILSSLSDYHIFYKFGWDREKTIANHLSIAEECLKQEIIPRCHIEDCTRDDINNVVVPFIQRLMRLSEEYGMPTKVRVCDTLGLGVPYPEAALPRSIPKIMNAITSKGGLPCEWLEYHGHNDFHLAVAASTSAWMYGASGNNCTLLGIGERAGNTPLEGMLFQLLQLRPELRVDTKIIAEIADYYQTIGYRVPEFYPIVGRNFNVTRAGIHADGLVKNPEIYTPYDFGEIIGRAPKSVVSQYSGSSGIAWRINDLLHLSPGKMIDKNHRGVLLILKEVSQQYAEGRVTAFSDVEIMRLTNKYMSEVVALSSRQAEPLAPEPLVEGDY